MFEGRITMKKSVAPSILALLLLSPLAYAGVVMDMVTMNASGQETERSRIYAQSGKIRMEQVAENENIRLQNLWDAMQIYGAVLANFGDM